MRKSVSGLGHLIPFVTAGGKLPVLKLHFHSGRERPGAVSGESVSAFQRSGARASDALVSAATRPGARYGRADAASERHGVAFQDNTHRPWATRFCPPSAAKCDKCALRRSPATRHGALEMGRIRPRLDGGTIFAHRRQTVLFLCNGARQSGTRVDGHSDRRRDERWPSR